MPLLLLGSNLVCSGIVYLHEGKTHLFVAASKDTCFIASVIIKLLFNNSILLYLPIISAIKCSFTISFISVFEIIAISNILSSPNILILSIMPEVRYFLKCIQKEGAVIGFSFLKLVKCILGFCALQEITKLYFCPLERIFKVISSFSG